MTLVVPRMIGAVAGFIAKHGTWPTRLVVPSENWHAYRADPDPVLRSYDGPAARAIFARLELVPVPRQLYVALDAEGRSFEYGAEEVPGDASDLVERSIAADERGTPGAPPPVLRPPIPNSYVVPGTRLVAGEYPGSPPDAAREASEERLAAFVRAGIAAFIDLTDPADRLVAYDVPLKEVANRLGEHISYRRLTIRDMDVCDPEHMRRVLDAIDAQIALGRSVYVHCWGGIGRTGMVVGCWLVRHGVSGAEALRQVDALFRTMSPEKVRRHASWGSPQTPAQRAMVRDWKEVRRALAVNGGDGLDVDGASPRGTRGPGNGGARSTVLSSRPDVTSETRDRMRGALIGLAVGDAVGTTVEFRAPGSFPAVTDMTGGGPFRLKAGQWTDDTSMALCLSESLIECRGFDAADQMRRYLRWRDEGHLSSTGKCFDIGNTIGAALRAFEASGEPFSGPTGEMTAGNGSLMRLAPVPIFYFGRDDDLIARAGESSRTTHGAAVAVDACRYLAALIAGAIGGATKEALLSPRFTPTPGYWERHPLHPAIASIADGSFTTKEPPAIRGSGYAAQSLEAALWAFSRSSDFREGCLLAVNLGDDADTTAAIYGQLAGAFYGESGIPDDWAARLAHKPLLDRLAETLSE